MWGVELAPEIRRRRPEHELASCKRGAGWWTARRFFDSCRCGDLGEYVCVRVGDSLSAAREALGGALL